MDEYNIEGKENKPTTEGISIPNQKEKISNNKIKNEMEEKNEHEDFAFGSICDQLGLDTKSNVANVINRIGDLVKTEDSIKKVTKELNDLKIAKEGVDAKLANANTELNQVKSELQSYKDAEEAKKNAEVEAFVDAAIEAKKISADSKAKWMEMAKSNYDMVKDTINSIPSADKISDAIAKDADNVEDAKKDVVDETEAKVMAAVGKEFKFKKLG